MASSFDNVVYKWLKDSLALAPAFTGVTVIRAEQNGPRPEGDYVTYKVLDWTESDFDNFEKSEQDPESNDLDVLHTNRNRVTVSVNAYSANGREILGRFAKSKKVWEIRRELQNEKVTHLRTNQVRDLTYLGDTEYRRRFQTDFIFLVWTKLLEVRPKVLEISASGNYHFDEQSEV